MMEKRNVVEQKRTPDHERERKDEHWDKEAAAEFGKGKTVTKLSGRTTRIDVDKVLHPAKVDVSA